MNFAQIFDVANIGLVVLDKDLKVTYWNLWMERQTGIPADRIKGGPVFDFFPNLNSKGFNRNCKSVFAFGNLVFFSQKLHNFLFPCKPVTSFNTNFEFMQQSCTMGPLRDETDNSKIDHVYILIQDVTELVAFEHKLIDMNRKDGLTGICNRRFFDVRLKEGFESHKRYSRPFSLIMFDIDHFKNVNDKYGHQCGDFILKSVTSRIAETVRSVDILARYGGEEFCCLLTETDLQPALNLAERFRVIISEKKFCFEEISITITISLGVSELRKEINSPDMLLKMADDALYGAKRSGRNKVVSIMPPQAEVSQPVSA